MVPTIEQHVDWIADCIASARDCGRPRIEATREAEDNWMAHHQEVAAETLFPSCNSWYVGANVPGKPRTVTPYTGGMPAYVEKCEAVVANGYEGFTLTDRLNRPHPKGRECEWETAKAGGLRLPVPPWRWVAGLGSHVGGDGNLDQVEGVRGRDLVVRRAARDVERVPFHDANRSRSSKARSIQPLSM